MFLRATTRKKDGKEHRYWSVVENRRVAGSRVVQGHVLYLGEINSSQELAWRRSIEVLAENVHAPRTLALFPEDRCDGLAPDASIVRLRLSQLSLRRPRQWGACCLALGLWQELGLEEFWAGRLSTSRKGTRWNQVLFVLTVYRLLAHKEALFTHLVERWRDLFNASFDVLLYDLTSTYFESDPPVQYLVGTPKGRLNRLERALLAKPWREARPGVQVKLLAEEGELYVFAQSAERIAKERAMRGRQLKWLWARPAQPSAMSLSRDALLMHLGSAQTRAPAAWRLLDIPVTEHDGTLGYRLNRDKLRKARRREGHYLLRANLTETDPVKLWSDYLQLVAVEDAFRTLKGDLAIRPIFHQDQERIEAHIFIAFLAYCLHVSLGRRLRAPAPGLTTRRALEKFAAVQMVDVHIPTTDGRELWLTRYTQPEPELKLLLERLRLTLPAQPPPRITAAQAAESLAM